MGNLLVDNSAFDISKDIGLEHKLAATAGTADGLVLKAPSSPTQPIQAGETLQRLHTGYQTAVQVQQPRDPRAIARKVLAECDIAGSDFYYSWTVKGRYGSQTVEGESIGLAMAIYRNWGNSHLDVDIAFETSSHWHIKATILDLETGAHFNRLFIQRKNAGPGGKMDKDRQQDIAFQIGQSKAIRNCILHMAPKWLREGALRRAKGAAGHHIVQRAGGLDNARDMLCRWFKDRGVSQERLEDKLAKLRDEWSATDCGTIRGLITGITSGETTVNNEFPHAEIETVVPKEAAKKPEPQPAPKMDPPRPIHDPLFAKTRAAEKPKPEPWPNDDGRNTFGAYVDKLASAKGRLPNFGGAEEEVWTGRLQKAFNESRESFRAATVELDKELAKRARAQEKESVADAITNFLSEDSSSYFSRSQILRGTGVNHILWTPVIQGLMSDGKVQTIGKGRGLKYASATTTSEAIPDVTPETDIEKLANTAIKAIAQAASAGKLSPADKMTYLGTVAKNRREGNADPIREIMSLVV